MTVGKYDAITPSNEVFIKEYYKEST